MKGFADGIASFAALTILLSAVVLLSGCPVRVEMAINPAPADLAEDVSETPVLSWQDGGGAAGYDVYFGTDPIPGPAEFKGSQEAAVYEPGLLDYETTYYWRVDPHNGASSATGNVWRFTTKPSPLMPAKDPDPADQATVVPMETGLGWANGGGATSFDVYFGMDPSPDSGEFKGNQAGTAYYPGTLAYSTTYYWRVDARGAAGTLTGPVWRFTTAPPLPKPAKYPDPADGATGVSVDATLDWEDGGDADSYDVYFGTGTSLGPEDFMGNQAGTGYDPGTLEYDTTYSWRIDARNAAGATTGPVWRFATPVRTISFSGYEWVVQGSHGMRDSPGPNYYSDSPDSVWVDGDGLHLTIQRRNGRWYCSEVFAVGASGYGVNRFSVVGRVDRLDKNVVFAPFLYADDAHEMDIEFSLWGDAASSFNTLYTIQPSPEYKFTASLSGDYSTHFLDWQAGGVRFKSVHGHYAGIDDDAPLICDATLHGSIPLESDGLSVHINLWLFDGLPPSDGNDVEVVIKSVDLSQL